MMGSIATAVRDLVTGRRASRRQTVASRTTKRAAVTGGASEPSSILSARFKAQLSELRESTEARLSAYSRTP